MPYVYSIIAGQLPPGITLTSAGLVNGVPTNSGLYTATVQALDTVNATGTRVYDITINVPTTTTPVPQNALTFNTINDSLISFDVTDFLVNT